MSANPFRLTAAEIASVESDIEQMIEADDTTASVMRPVIYGAETFDGPYEGDMTSAGTIVIEFVTDLKAEILQPDSDGIADVKKGSGVKKWDRIEFTDKRGVLQRYRVRHIRDYRPFGAYTHDRLEMKSEWGEESSP